MRTRIAPRKGQTVMGIRTSIHTSTRRFRRAGRIVLTALCLLLLFTAIPLPAAAQETEHKTVRVGWHEEPYFITDS